MIDTKIRFELMGELEKINRMDLWAKPECLEYWHKQDNPTIKECINVLLSKYPSKKIYTKKIVTDPFRD